MHFEQSSTQSTMAVRNREEASEADRVDRSVRILAQTERPVGEGGVCWVMQPRHASHRLEESEFRFLESTDSKTSFVARQLGKVPGIPSNNRESGRNRLSACQRRPGRECVSARVPGVVIRCSSSRWSMVAKAAISGQGSVVSSRTYALGHTISGTLRRRPHGRSLVTASRPSAHPSDVDLSLGTRLGEKLSKRLGRQVMNLQLPEAVAEAMTCSLSFTFSRSSGLRFLIS